MTYTKTECCYYRLKIEVRQYLKTGKGNLGDMCVGMTHGMITRLKAAIADDIIQSYNLYSAYPGVDSEEIFLREMEEYRAMKIALDMYASK